MKYIFLILSMIVVSTSSHAYEAYVERAGVYGDGSVFIVLSSAYPLAECASPEVWVTSNNPAKKDILSVAMTAVAANKIVGIVIAQCNAPGGRPTFTIDTGSYIYLKR